MSTLSQIRSAVQANWPSNYHSSYITDTKIDAYINAVQRWACRGTIITPDYKIINYNFSWMKVESYASTVDSQQRYALPDGDDTAKFKSEISCELTDTNNYRVRLQRRHKRDIENDTDYIKTTKEGTPKCYAIDDNDLWLYPIPDHSLNSNTAWTFNLEYYGYLADLSGDSDTNTITNDYPELLEYGATEMGYRYGRDTEEAQYWKNLKDLIFIEMIQADQQLELTGIEEGLQPLQGFGIADGEPGNTYYYNNDTPYD